MNSRKILIIIALVLFGAFVIGLIYVEAPEFIDQKQAYNQKQNKDQDVPFPPKILNLSVPFTSQAPTGNWDIQHEENCEEASALMVAEYFQGNRENNLSPIFAEEKMANLVNWENENYSYNFNTTSSETAEMISQIYGLKTKIIQNFTVDDFKSELAQNHLIILPAYGRRLNNPNFKAPGPIYHMLVVRGYVQNGFLTNDPGTRKGMNYFYSFSTLYAASANWSHQINNIDQSQKVAIIVWQ